MKNYEFCTRLPSGREVINLFDQQFPKIFVNIKVYIGILHHLQAERMIALAKHGGPRAIEA